MRVRQSMQPTKVRPFWKVLMPADGTFAATPRVEFGARALQPPARRIESLAAESLHEPLGVLRLREAVNLEPLLVVEDGMTTAAQTQVFAKLMSLFVAAAFAESRRQRHLMRSPAITARRRPLALPSHRRTAA